MASYLTLQFNEAMLFAGIENTILLGQQEGGSISGVQERSATASQSNSSDNQNQETKDKKLSEFLHTVQVIQDYIDRLAKTIDQMEDVFRQRDGDAWREKLALRILGEDDIPQQESGETIQAYRERLEKHLINEMLNPDGTIKDKYKNDPRHADYAEWAQKQYHLKNAKALVTELEDKNTPPQRQEQILVEMEERGYAEEMMLADRESALGNSSQAEIKDITNAVQVEKHNDVRSPNAINDFIKPIG